MTFIPARGGLVLLDTKVASNSATLDFTTGITDRFDEYEIHYGSILPATDATSLNIRTSTDGGSNYDSGGSDYRWSYGGNRDNSTTWATGGGTVAQMQITTGMGNQSGEKAFGRVRCNGLRDSACWKVFNSVTGAYSSDPAGAHFIFIGVRASSTVVNAIRLYCTAGNITSGWARLYGVRK